ncbi:MAG: hypothetical protein D6738_00685 [Acidobacteria bacterium]|nr:MAG: hypothetical protein D6738_00685 [Acidobacteriota bacterium]
MLVRLDELAAGSDAEVRVLTRHGARTFALRREPPRRERWSLERIGAGARRERLWLTTVRVAVEPADGGETLLGLSGPTMLTIDRGSGALLAIEGRRDGVPGTIRLALRRWGAAVEPRPAVPWDVFRDPVPAGTEPAGAAVDGPRSLP